MKSKPIPSASASVLAAAAVAEALAEAVAMTSEAPQSSPSSGGESVASPTTPTSLLESTAQAAAVASSSASSSLTSCADSLQTIGAQMQIILSRLADESASLRASATELALAAARKIAGEALKAYPLDTIEQLTAEAVQDLRGQDVPPQFRMCARSASGHGQRGVEQ